MELVGCMDFIKDEERKQEYSLRWMQKHGVCDIVCNTYVCMLSLLLNYAYPNKEGHCLSYTLVTNVHINLSSEDHIINYLY